MKAASWVNKYVGLPYKSHGRTEAGLDCFGAVRIILNNEYDIELPSYDTEYTDEVEQEVLDELIAGRTDWVRVDSPQEGDIVVMRIRKHFFHVGIMVNRSHFLNCRSKVGCVVEELSSRFWQPKIEGFYRHISRKE